MTASEEYGLQRYKQCAGMDCHNSAAHRLEIVYIKKAGWFCNSCKDDLIADGLVNEITGHLDSA